MIRDMKESRVLIRDWHRSIQWLIEGLTRLV